MNGAIVVGLPCRWELHYPGARSLLHRAESGVSRDPAGEDREMPSDGGSGGGLGILHGGNIHGTAGSTAGHGRATTGTAIPNDGADGS